MKKRRVPTGSVGGQQYLKKHNLVNSVKTGRFTKASSTVVSQSKSPSSKPNQDNWKAAKDVGIALVGFGASVAGIYAANYLNKKLGMYANRMHKISLSGVTPGNLRYKYGAYKFLKAVRQNRSKINWAESSREIH